MSEDHRLAEALLAGDRGAFALAVARLEPMLRRMVARDLGPDEDPSDIIQDVYLALVQDVASLREPKALRAFVMTIAVHCIHREIRQRRRWRRLSREAEARVHIEGPLAQRSPEPVSMARIAEHLRTMRALEQTVFTLRWVEGIPLHIVAARTGLSLSTVKRILRRLRERLVCDRRLVRPNHGRLLPSTPLAR